MILPLNFSVLIVLLFKYYYYIVFFYIQTFEMDLQ